MSNEFRPYNILKGINLVLISNFTQLRRNISRSLKSGSKVMSHFIKFLIDDARIVTTLRNGSDLTILQARLGLNFLTGR
ncbi:hypothetical protein BpHYR1_011455 [Brachionus plicatilis]|uniref:Uncharacterized protein n=1 Tax=Brachionus plicatilis TaxID=10195 RepID=A0A3M7QF11_BRAPC|nr:hypothetical protein BpHYR1_011455 [Brachionus plicatilis]